MVTITFTKQERKALSKGSILFCVSMPPPWDTWTIGGVRVPTYRNRVVIFSLSTDILNTLQRISRNSIVYEIYRAARTMNYWLDGRAQTSLTLQTMAAQL